VCHVFILLVVVRERRSVLPHRAMLPYDDSDIRLVSKMHVAHYGYRASAEMDVIMDSCVDLGCGAGCITRMFSLAKYGEHGPECNSVMGFLDG
jgi:hypothetical protein